MMLTEANKQVVRKFVDAVNRQDWQRFDELVSLDFVLHSSTFGQSQVNNRDRPREYLIAERKAVAALSVMRYTQR